MSSLLIVTFFFSLHAAKYPFGIDCVNICLRIQTVQPYFQAFFRFKGRCKESLRHIHMFHEPIRSFELILDVETSAENATRLQNAAGFPKRGVLIGKGVKSVQRENDIEALMPRMLSSICAASSPDFPRRSSPNVPQRREITAGSKSPMTR